MMERPAWQKILYEIWPTIRRVVNDTLFFFEKIIRSFIATVLKQV